VSIAHFGSGKLSATRLKIVPERTRAFFEILGSSQIPGGISCSFLASNRDRLPILSRQIAHVPASTV
jgi:hypothetical protein